MFRCQLCGGVVPPNTPALRKIVETRRREYPPRKHANQINKDGKKERTDDPGGVGSEIVREILVCSDCSAVPAAPLQRHRGSPSTMAGLQPRHRISFERKAVFRPRTYELLIFIDGVDLRYLVHQVELNYIRDKSKAVETGYSGIHWHQSMDPLVLLRHYLGEPDPFYSYGSRAQILGCTCGEPGCWPLLCRIEATNDLVQWSDFQQYHKMGRPRPWPWSSDFWDYSSLGPFLFDRSQFEDAFLAAQGRATDVIA